MTTPHETYERCVIAARGSLGGAPEKRAEDAAIYLAHVEGSESLRRLAAAAGRPPSSIHRAIRRIEALRDDPLLDQAFDALGDVARRLISQQDCSGNDIMNNALQCAATTEGETASTVYQDRVAERTLERLSEQEAFMMVAQGAEKAGVFSRRNRFRRPLALLTVEAAADLAARDFVRCVSRTQMSAKYAISDVGRAWLKRRLAETAAEAATGPVRAGRAVPQPFAAQHAVPGERVVAGPGGETETLRVNLGESPLGWLAARRGADGTPFLTPDEVEAGERLRADFEAAHAGPRVTQDWRSFLTPHDGGVAQPSGGGGSMFAQDRLRRALQDLGPGLADVALRTCCYLEGLEATERSLGWSARSGKVVLKIALQRLALHYGIARLA